jgi:hypothetical protein
MHPKYRPFDLVRVKEQFLDTEVAYFGQLISYPTPEETIMVRRVPDDPSTMVEMPLSAIELVSFPRLYRPHWVQYAKVSGRFDFPVDMLRYDSCVPVNFTLEESERGQVITQVTDGGPDLIVAKATSTRQDGFTYARWASFSWTAQGLKTLKIESR